jgi:hypothetical protein
MVLQSLGAGSLKQSLIRLDESFYRKCFEWNTNNEALTVVEASATEACTSVSWDIQSYEREALSSRFWRMVLD